VAEVVTSAMAQYCEEVRQRKFPADEHCYRMIKGEDEKFLRLMDGK
jgi:3-methyl-2-oxobutanoate hydroxymethyltransferase